jgi:Ca2+-binding EF-hand superfamily protein
MDQDASGGLNLKELRKEMKLQGEYSSETALKKLFEDIDSNQDGIITFQEADQHQDANP